MRLTNIKIKNYRLLVETDLEVDENTTLIVGRNNTAKTSCVVCLDRVLKGLRFSYDDYPMNRRNDLHSLIVQFMSKKITYDELCKNMPTISIEFNVDYSDDNDDDNLGALSPFIIDVEEDTTTAIIRIEDQLVDESSLWKLLEPFFYNGGKFVFAVEEIRDICVKNFSKMFFRKIYAINPKNLGDRQLKTQNELSTLFPFYVIPAERVLGEDGSQNNNSLSELISSFFNIPEDELDSKIAKEVTQLRQIVDDVNKEIQKKSDTLLSSIIEKSIGFGYPNSEELRLAVTTELSIDEQIKNKTKLSYFSDQIEESLPSTYNGLGYNNLIKMEFLLAAYTKDIQQKGVACIPLLVIEEPESHMHPQLQHAFADYIEKFVGRLSDIHVQIILTSHSAHIANTLDFSKIRYVQKTKNGVIYKNLYSFAITNKENLDFVRKYLTLTKCDLFFADKVILVEGASERLLMPDFIIKCENAGLFAPQKYTLASQYYSLIEIGGAYAHKFIPFIEFLGIPCLIITDIDSLNKQGNIDFVGNSCKTSNETIKWWYRKVKSLPDGDKKDIKLADIFKLSKEQKTIKKCHIEFQTAENGLCGRSLEEAVKNSNRLLYKIEAPYNEEKLKFTGSKTDFALNLICEFSDYNIPQYIKDGLVWLNAQKVME